MPSLLELLVLAVVIFLTAVLVAFETALTTVTHARLVALEKSGVRGASAAVRMRAQIERSLAALQLGITVLGSIAGVFGGASVEEKLSPLLIQRFGWSDHAADAFAVFVVVVPLAAFTIVFAELSPKIVAIRNKERVCCLLAPAMEAFATIAAPVVGVLEAVVRGVAAVVTLRAKSLRGGESSSLHELTAAAALARSAKIIGAREERIVTQAATLSSRTIGEIALPASDISTMAADATLENALVRAHLDMHTRFPVATAEGDPQTIVGYVTFKDLVMMLRMAAGPANLRAITRPILRVESTRTIAKALDTLVRDRSHIALVVDPSGAVVGMVTLEDVIEELVGDIEDEFDRLPSHWSPTGDGFIAGGGLPFDAVLRRLDLAATKTSPPATSGTTQVEVARALTLADWVQQRLGRAPAGGESIVGDGVQVLVRKLRRKRLAEAFVRLSDRTRAAAAGASKPTA
jgi:putative hemolysin